MSDNYDRRKINRPSRLSLGLKFGLPALAAGLGGFTVGQNNPAPTAAPPALNISINLDRKLLDQKLIVPVRKP